MAPQGQASPGFQAARLIVSTAKAPTSAGEDVQCPNFPSPGWHSAPCAFHQRVAKTNIIVGTLGCECFQRMLVMSSRTVLQSGHFFEFFLTFVWKVRPTYYAKHVFDRRLEGKPWLRCAGFQKMGLHSRDQLRAVLTHQWRAEGDAYSVETGVLPIAPLSFLHPSCL